MLSIIIIIIFVLASFFVLDKFHKLNVRIKGIEGKVATIEDFNKKLIDVSGWTIEEVPEKISKYLLLRKKHIFENVYHAICNREISEKIDWEALEERQKQEMKNLVSEEQGEIPEGLLYFPVRDGMTIEER